MQRKTQIDVIEAIAGIKSGLSDAAMMRKFGLSAQGLHSLFCKLVSSGYIPQTDLDARSAGESLEFDLVKPVRALARRPSERAWRCALAVTINADILSAVKRMSREVNIEVANCGDGALAAELCRMTRPNLIVAEAMLCSTDDIRSMQECSADSPIIVVSDPEDRKRLLEFLELGIFGFCEKPSNEAMLMHEMRKAVRFELLNSALERMVGDGRKLTEPAVGMDILSGLLNGSTSATVILLDLTFSITLWNSGAERTLGYLSEDAVGKDFVGLCVAESHAHSMGRALVNVAHKQSGGQCKNAKMRAADGRRLNTPLALSPVLDGAGEVKGILAVGLNLSNGAGSKTK